MSALVGAEITVSAVLLIPWVLVFARRGVASYARDDAGHAALKSLVIGAPLLLAGQVLSFVPSFVELGPALPWALFFGQLTPAMFRVLLIWALWRVRRAYLSTGLGFHLTALDRVAAIAVVGAALFIITRHDVLWAYWAAHGTISPTAAALVTGVQVTNYVLYPALFFASLTMYRYSAQMSGGRLATAWGGIAAYGLLQPLHAFTLALAYPRLGPVFALTVDDFIVLAAFASLALGSVVHAEIAELEQPSTGLAGAAASRAS
jgi:hypothetical protein